MQPSTTSRPIYKRPVLWALAAAAAAVGVFVLVWFQPQKLFIDKTVDEAFPELERVTASTQAAGTEAAAMSSPTTAATATPDAAATPGTSGLPTGAAPAEAAAAEVAPQPSGPVLRSQGAFVSRDHETTGTALIVAQPDGSLVLRLEELDTDNGPDLRVLLSPAAGDDTDYETGSIELGALKGNKGNQNYDIPAGTDLDAVRSVIIWCERFSVAFGSAELAVA